MCMIIILEKYKSLHRIEWRSFVWKLAFSFFSLKKGFYKLIGEGGGQEGVVAHPSLSFHHCMMRWLWETVSRDLLWCSANFYPISIKRSITLHERHFVAKAYIRGFKTHAYKYCRLFSAVYIYGSKLMCLKIDFNAISLKSSFPAKHSAFGKRFTW
jgi:hypothetical protein